MVVRCVSCYCFFSRLQKENRWSDDGVTEQGYDAVTRVLTVHTIRLAPMAVIQPRFLDFPYLSWSVEPTGDHRVVMTLRTQRFAVKIEVTGNMCRLVEPDLLEFTRQRTTMLKPGRLLMELAQSGLNLMPVNEDAMFLETSSGARVVPKVLTETFRSN
jgi:hypothetical protein